MSNGEEQGKVVPKWLSREDHLVCAARIRCLDHYMAQNNSAFGGDFDFVVSMKDWVDKKKRTISFRQEWRITQIWNNIEEHTELDYEPFLKESE